MPRAARTPQTRRTRLFIAAGAIALLVGTGTVVALVGSVFSRESGANAAGPSIESAVRWLERRAAEGSDELSRLVREHTPERLLAQASERLVERLGVFEFRPGDAGENWERFDSARPDPADAEEDRSTVILIHGLDEPGDIWNDLAPALHLDGHRVLRFNYSNDQHPERSADEFAAALEQVQRAGVDPLAIVAHSMGGLIARDVLTRHAQADAWAGPDISRLVTLGTPNQGSPVAALQPVGEAREVVARLWTARELDPSELLSFLVDGTGEAAVALAEGSSYLKDLNARPLPSETPITIIAARATAAQRDKLDELAGSAPVAGLIDEDTRAWLLARVDEMTDRIGDGVVPLDSTPLKGVADYRVVVANHRSMLRTVPVLSTEETPPAIPIVLEVLRTEPEPDQPDPSPKSP